MSISYSVLRTDRKVTLPSVTNWGANANILRDPPKSIHTRKIDKVGQTSSLTQMIEEAGDRSAEAINFYPRGVNPMVAVSYSNASNNAGQNNGVSHVGQARYPYRTNDAFRPPMVPQEDLLPLSRLPRVWTSSFTQPGFADFSKKMIEPTSEDGKTVGAKSNSRILRTNVRPNLVVKTNVGIVEPYDTKNNISNRVSVEAFSGLRTLDKFDKDVGEFRNVINSKEYINVSTNIGKQTNPSLDGISDLDVNSHISNPLHVSVQGTLVGHAKNDYIHDDIELKRNLPAHSVELNKGKTIYTNNVSDKVVASLNRPYTEAFTNTNMAGGNTISTDVYNLKPKISAGEYEREGSKMPSDYHNGLSVNIKPNRIIQRREMFNQMRG